MGNVNDLLSERLKKGDRSTKMAALAQRSAAGQLTGFSGIFSVSDLNSKEKEQLEFILREHSDSKKDVRNDLNSLISITSEVKAINNQAAILHGERIKKVQALLKNYRDGAFTAWLVAAYGNRQTPYNFLQYFEFHEAMPRLLRLRMESMPRQAIYTLASRTGSFETKKRIVENYKGETKRDLLLLIRETFPLDKRDKRRHSYADSALQELKRIFAALKKEKRNFSSSQKSAMTYLLKAMLKEIQ